jgi:hypothetical protein
MRPIRSLPYVRQGMTMFGIISQDGVLLSPLFLNRAFVERQRRSLIERGQIRPSARVEAFVSVVNRRAR